MTSAAPGQGAADPMRGTFLADFSIFLAPSSTLSNPRRGCTRPRQAMTPRRAAADGLRSRRVLAHHAQLDMDPLAARGVMALSGSEQFLRLFRAFGFDPPLLDTRDQHGCVKGPQLGPLLPLKGSRRHLPIPNESNLSNHFTLKPARVEQTESAAPCTPPPGAWNTLLSTSLSPKPDRSYRQ